VGTGHVVALADGFRAVIRGAEGRPKSWEPDRLGALAAVVYQDDGGWRPDALARTRILLRRIVGSYLPAVSLTSSRALPAHVRLRVAQYWGVSGYPVVPTLGNPVVEWGIADDEHEPPPGAVQEAPVEAGTAVASQVRQVRRWAVSVAAHPESLAIADGETGLPHAVLDKEYWAPRAEAVGFPRWNTAPDQVENWPPGGMPGEEAHWMLERLSAHFDIDDPRLVGLSEDPNARRRQLTQVLRRRAVDMHEAYLGVHAETENHFSHLGHAMARKWFDADLQDLGGVMFREAAPESETRRTMLRSQAAIAQLMFYSVVHDWDQTAIDQILERRSSARLLFLGVDELGDPLERLHQRVLHSQRRLYLRGTVPKDDEADSGRKKQPLLPPFVTRATPEVQQLFRAALAVRAKTDRQSVRDYIELRTRFDDKDEWDRLGIDDKRTVLFADQAVHLDAVKLELPAVMVILDHFLVESSKARAEYGSYLARDEAMLRGKSNTRRGLEESVAAALRGARQIDGVKQRAGSLYATTLFSERAALETEQQMNLAMSGVAVKVLEALMEAPAHEQDEMSERLILNRIAAAMRWSAATLASLTQLEENGWLGETRYSDGFLAEASWRGPSKMIRHRILIAAYALKSAFGLHDHAPQLSVLDLDVAYVRMVTEPKTSAVTQVVQGMLLHSFVTAGAIPDGDGPRTAHARTRPPDGGCRHRRRRVPADPRQHGPSAESHALQR